MNEEKKTKAIKWTLTTTRLPEPEYTWFLMCSVYIGAPPDGDIEWFYEIGSFENGKFLDKEKKEYSPLYWVKINEPHAWECE